MLTNNVKYIPQGHDPEHPPTSKIGVRLTPGGCAAYMELTQEDDLDDLQAIELTLSQMHSLYQLIGEQLRVVATNQLTD